MPRGLLLSIPAGLDGVTMVDGCARLRAMIPAIWPGVIATAPFGLVLARDDAIVATKPRGGERAVTIPRIDGFPGSTHRGAEITRAAAAVVSAIAPLVRVVASVRCRIAGRPTAGAVSGRADGGIVLGDRNVDGLQAEDRDLAMTLQSYELFHNPPAREDIRCSP